MSQKQHRSLLNAGTLLEFAQKLSPSSTTSRERRSYISAPSPPTTPDSPSSQPNSGSENVPSGASSSTYSPLDGIEHGEDAVVALASGEATGQGSTSSPARVKPRQPEATLAAGQRETSIPSGGADGPVPGSLPPAASGSEKSVGGGATGRVSGSPPVVVIVGDDPKEDESLSAEGEMEVMKEGVAMTAVAGPTTKHSGDGAHREKDVKRSTSLKQSIFRSLKPSKGERRGSEPVSKDGSGLESESEDASNMPGSLSLSSPSPIHVSQSCPSELPLLREKSQQQQQQQQHLGLDTSGSSLGSPSDKVPLPGRSSKEDKSPKSGKRNSKKSPWYTVLSSSYKSKSEEFRKYFKNIHNNEKLIADYSCALQKDILVQGRIYVTENWLCFYANIFKWETLLTVRLKEITAITKERTIRLIPNAIQITTETEKYFFTSFMSRDKTFLLLFKVWQNALLDQKMLPAEYWTRVHSYYGANLGLGQDELPDDYVQPSLSQDETENGENEFDESKSQGTEGMDEEEDEEEEEEDEVEEGSGEPSGMDGDKQSEVTDQEVTGQLQVTRTGDAVDLHDTVDDEGEVQSLEAGPLHPNAKEYMNAYFNVTVDTFFAALYNKEHPFYRNFLLYRKHTDIVIGEWKPGEEQDTRSVCYTFHLNNPVGPKSCGVQEKQILQKKLSRHGHSYIIHLEVLQTGAPYTDYFYTEARMVITRVSSTSCHVRVSAHLVYKKSPWGPIKGFIERNAESGLKLKHADLDTYGKQHLENRAPVKPPTKKGKKRSKAGKAVKEEIEEQARPIRRGDSLPKVNLKTNLPSRYLPSWLQTDSKNIMLLICLFLTFLSIVNVSLFLQLQSLEQLAGRTDQSWSADGFTDKFKEIPQSKDEWSSLLQKQLYFHEMEMERWRDVLGLCIDLMKKMEITLQELHKGIKPTRIPDLEKILQNVDLNAKPPDE